MKWEKLDSGIGEIWRAKVPGGWLVLAERSVSFNNSAGIGVGLAFYPDPNHTWSGLTLP